MKIKTKQLVHDDKQIQDVDYQFLYVQEKFYDFLRNCFRCQKPEKQDLIKKAFLYLQNSTRDIFLIEHSLEVAQVTGVDIGLGTTSVVAALLHELPDKTGFQVDDIRMEFGREVADIIDGFYRIKNTERYFKPDDSENAELYKSIVLNMAKDLRIISLRIADRLVTLRHFDRVSLPNKSIIPEETLKIYAPIADVLGSYRVKMEMEDLAFKYYKPDVYKRISNELKSSLKENTVIINKTALPLIKEIFDTGLKFKIVSRQKSIYSIYKKLENKKLSSIDDIYDILAFRVILFSDNDMNQEERIEQEKKLCKSVGQMIMDLYEIHPDRIRNWIDKPKEGSGYMALHMTVRDPRIGRWVEIQVRGEIMHEIAEYGYAAHWKYKGVKLMFDEFSYKLKELKHALENVDEDIDTVFELVNPLIPVEKILVYSPDLQEYRLTKGATVLDFAAKVHTDLVKHILGARINNSKSVPPTYKVQHGDIVEIIKSQKQITPPREWLDKVRTSEAKKMIKQLLNIRDPKKAGMQKLFAIASENNVVIDNVLIKEFLRKFDLKSKDELYVAIGSGYIKDEQLKGVLTKFRRGKFFDLVSVFGKSNKSIENYRIATCCSPAPGDKLLAVRVKDDLYEVHRIDCPMIEKYLEESKPIVPVQWKVIRKQSLLKVIKFTAKDEFAVVYKISKVLYNALNANVEAMSLQKNEKQNIYIGTIKLYVSNLKELDRIIENLRNTDSVLSVEVKK